MPDNFFDQFDGAQGQEATVQQGARPTLYERFKANMDAGTLEGTPEGSVGLMMRQAVEDAQRRNGMPIDPSVGRDRDALDNYETMPAWDGIPEGAAALAGQLVGGLKAPSSFIGGSVAPVREAVTQGAARVLPKAAAEAVGRTAEQGVVQAGIQTAVNPVVQGANVASGVQEAFDPNALATAPFMGFALGAAAHGLTEGAGAFRDAAVFHAMREKLATADPDFLARPGPANDTGPTVTAPAIDSSVPSENAVVPPSATALIRSRDYSAMTFTRDADGKINGVVVTPRDGGEPVRAELSIDAKGEPTGIKNVPAPEPEKSFPSVKASEPQGRPLTLSEFIAKGGGIPLDGEARARDLNRALVPGAGPIARKAGKSIDGHWREALIEAGYFPADADGGAARDITKELFDGLDAERQGRKIYSAQDQDRIPQKPDHVNAAVEAEASRISREMEAAGVTRDTLDRGALYTAAERMFKGEDHDPVSAYERAVMELPEDTRAGAPLMFPEAAADLQFRKGRPKAEPLQFKKRSDTPSNGSGSPTGPIAGAVGSDPANAAQRASMSLQQQALHLAETMDLPLRQGRVQGGKAALGQYDRTQGVARVKQVPDFETVAHEGGHHLEAQMGQPLKDLIAKNAGELAPLDYDQIKQRPSEGFAEFFSHYLVNPAYAKREAPTFYDAFRALLADKRPELLDALDGAAREFQAFRNAPDTEKVGLAVVDQEHETWTSEARKSLKKDGLAPTIMAMVGRAYMAVFDRHAPMTTYVRAMLELAHEKNGGKLIDLKSADNPEVLIRLLERSKQGAEYQFRYGIVPYHDADAIGPSLHDALALATGQPSLLGNWDDELVGKFADYLAAKRAVVLWDKVADGRLLRDPTPFSKDVALNAMADLEKANPAFAQASMMVHEFSRNLLKKQLDGGLIERDLYDRLLADPFYVPLYRDMEDKALSGPTAGGQSPQGPGMTDTIKRQKGSLRDIINPIQGLMAQTFLVERTLQHNDVIKALVGLADMAGNGAGRYVEKIPAKEMAASRFDLAEGIRSVAREKAVDPDSTEALLASLTDAFGDDPIMATMFKAQPARAKGEPIVFYKEGGELRAARIINSKEGLELYDLLTSLPRASQDIFSSVLGVSAQVLRSGITSNPTFILTNYIRDQFAVSILRQGYVPIVSGLKGIKAEITQNEAARLYSYFGGGMPGAVAGTLHAAEASNINAIGKKTFGQIRLGEGLKGLSEVMSITEAATRDSVFAEVYKQKMAEGLSKYEAGIEAAFQATDLLDFSRHGSRMEAVRRFIPFLNAHLQGLDKARRTIAEPLLTAAKGETRNGARTGGRVARASRPADGSGSPRSAPGRPRTGGRRWARLTMFSRRSFATS